MFIRVPGLHLPNQPKLRRHFLLHLCSAQRIFAPSFRPIRNLLMEVSDLFRFSLNHLRQSTVQLDLLLPCTLKVCCMALPWPRLTSQSRTGVPKGMKISPLTRVLNRVMLSILPMRVWIPGPQAAQSHFLTHRALDHLISRWGLLSWTLFSTGQPINTATQAICSWPSSLQV